RLDDALEDGVDDDLGLLLRQPGLAGHLLDELCLRHAAPPLLVIHDHASAPSAATASATGSSSPSSPSSSPPSSPWRPRRGRSSSSAARTTAASRTAAASFL